MNVRISAVICTLNRAGYLRKALQSLFDQTLPKDQYEVLVVDNGSTDDTKKIACEEVAHFSNLRYLYEPVRGLSQARNTGWRNATGGYITFLDDDAVAYSNWLERILDVFETIKPRPGCVGGKIDLIWEAVRPSWLSTDMMPYLGMLDLSPAPMVLNDYQYLYGGNIAFPRVVLENIGGFTSVFGRNGSKLLSNEELFLQRRLRERGDYCYYHPEILVGHHVAASRLSKRWFFRRAYWQGVSDAVLRLQQEKPNPLKRLWMGVTVVRQQLVSRRKLLALSVPSHSPDDFALKFFVIGRFGYVLGLWGLAR